MAQASGYGNYEIWLDGKPPAPPGLEHEPGADIRTDAQYDGYAWETYVGKTVQLGWPRLAKGRHTLTFVCTGKRSESTGYKAGIDNVILARVGAAAWAKAGEAKPPGFRPGDVPSLEAQLTDPDPLVRTLAACALRDKGAAALPALNALIARLKDPELYVRSAAAEAIGAIGPKAAPAVPALIAACQVKGEDPLPLRQYAYALGDIGPAARSALPTLEAMKADRRVEWVVVKTIAEIEGTRPGRSARRLGRPREQLPQHEGQDPAVPVVVDLDRRVDPEPQGRLRLASVRAADRERDLLPRAEACLRGPRRSNVSEPSIPSDARSTPSGNCRGSTPMPTRFERWMRSKLCATTARTPSSRVPFAAQSRELPGAVLLPAKITSGTRSAWYRIAAS